MSNELSKEQIENFRIALKTHHPAIRSAHDWEIDALCDLALRALEPSHAAAQRRSRAK